MTNKEITELLLNFLQSILTSVAFWVGVALIIFIFIFKNEISDFLKRLKKDLTNEEIVRELEDAVIFAAHFARIFREKKDKIESLIFNFFQRIEHEGISFNRQELEKVVTEVMNLKGRPLLEQLLERRKPYDPYEFWDYRGSAKRKREIDAEYEKQQRKYGEQQRRDASRKIVKSILNAL